MGTRYERGDKVLYKHATDQTKKEYTVKGVRNPESNSPDYMVERQHPDGGTTSDIVKASDLRMEDGGSGWKQTAHRELEDHVDSRLPNVSDKPLVGDSSRGAATFYNEEMEFDVFKSHQKAVRNAEREVAEDIYYNTQRFPDQLIKDNAYMTKTDIRTMANDMQEMRVDGLVHDKGIEYDEALDRTEDYRERVMRKLEEDPLTYLVDEAGLFSKAEAMDQGFIQIDEESAAETVVANDGVLHSISTYGDVIVLPSGAVAYKII